MKWKTTQMLALMAAVLLATSCDKLRDQPTPTPAEAPNVSDISIALDDSARGQVPLPSAKELAGGAVTIRYTNPKYGALTVDVARGQIMYKAGAQFRGQDTAQLSYTRGASTHSAKILINVGSLCIPRAERDTFLLVQPLNGPQVLGFLGNDKGCMNYTVSLQPVAGRPYRFRLQGNELVFEADAQFQGRDSIQYTISTPAGIVSQAWCRVRVLGRPINPTCTDPFIAQNYVFEYSLPNNSDAILHYSKRLNDLFSIAKHCPTDTLDPSSFVLPNGPDSLHQDTAYDGQYRKWKAWVNRRDQVLELSIRRPPPGIKPFGGHFIYAIRTKKGKRAWAEITVQHRP